MTKVTMKWLIIEFYLLYLLYCDIKSVLMSVVTDEVCTLSVAVMLFRTGSVMLEAILK